MIDSDQRPTQISIHWRHYLKSRSDLRVFSNRCLFQILRSMAYLLLGVRAYISDIFEKVRNGHRFENWTSIWEFEKGNRSEVDVCDVEMGHWFKDLTSIRGWTSIWVLHIHTRKHALITHVEMYTFLNKNSISTKKVFHQYASNTWLVRLEILLTLSLIDCFLLIVL